MLTSYHKLLGQLLDEILPATPKLPAASSVGLADLLEARSKQTPELAAALDEVLRACAERLMESGAADLGMLDAGARIALVQRLERERNKSFLQLTKRAHMDYYTHPEIPPLVGMPDRPPQPLGFQVDADENLEELLAPVRKRGKIWRDA